MRFFTEGLRIMKKKLSAVVVVIGVLLFAYLYAHIDKNTYLYDRNADSSDFTGTGILNGKEEVRQSFICTEDSLEGINLKATVIGDVQNVNVEYSLIDAESADMVRSGTVSGMEINNNKFNKLKFPVLEDTKGKNYILCLTESGNSSDAGVSFYLSAEDRQGQQLEVKGSKTAGVLVVRLLTHRFDLETFIVLLGIVGFIAGFMNILYKLFK